MKRKELNKTFMILNWSEKNIAVLLRVINVKNLVTQEKHREATVFDISTLLTGLKHWANNSCLLVATSCSQ